MYSIFTISTRARRSLQVLILQLNSRVCWSVLSFLSVCLCRVFTSRLLCNYSRDSAGVVFYTNGRRSFCACEQNGDLMWAQPIRSRFWISELSHQLFFFIYLRRCRTVLVGRMLRQYYLQNVHNFTYFVDFLSKT